MGVRGLGFSLVILLFLTDLTSSYPTRKTLPTATMQESKIMNGSKIEGGSHTAPHGGGGGAGAAHGNGEPGSGHSPNVPAGGGVIPVYAGGAAANNNRNHQIHRGAANNNLSRINVFTSIVITLACPLLLIL
ncbi:hypothetical protein HN51_029522 [Arachis hypogaea]|uniref:Uncharacterized protein n=1 Tax=Arachis hypogaea TaxID=3818 RepID=A0A445BEH5_ARAHY|nr:uncharacterized protein LOC112712147 [Arachis hypogaea]QHO36166.1 uncharacterized protein DS421_9g281510 [Arachis hypogaea]RYR37031.1 hypothetical protein Ahy_A09g041964 [Arachis hypogaea]